MRPGISALLLCFISLLSLAGTSLAAPNAPTYLAAYAETATSVVLLWNDNSSDETGFEVQYNTGGGWVSYGTLAANQTIVRLFTPTAFSAQYQVRAVNGSIYSAFTPSVTCTQASFNAPGSLNALVNKESAIITWADNATTETGFEIETRVLPSGTFSLLGSVVADAVVVDLAAYLAPNTSYEVRVRTRTGASVPFTYTGYSTNSVSLTTQFNAPTGLAATAVSETSVNLSWTDNSAIEGGYAVYFKPSSSGSYTLLDYTAANATSQTVTGLSPGVAYDFQVAAAYQSTSIIESARSNTAGTTTKDGFTSGTAPPIFFNQPFSYQAVVSAGSARTSWSITGLPTGLTFDSGTGGITGTPAAAGAFACEMSATFANGWTARSTLQLRVIRAAAAPVAAAAIGTQTIAAGGNAAVPLADKFSDPDSESAVRIVTSLGTMDFILYNSATPQTVANFLSYVNAAVNNYNGAVFHRSVAGFVAQGGAFKVQSAPNNFSVTPTSASPVNEPGISNVRGTVAMAKIGGNPNSATNQFFVNLGNNSGNLDRDSGSVNANGGFTAFARVAGNGMAVADAIGGLPAASYSVNLGGSATTMDDWPLSAASGSMDTTKVVSISSAAPVAVLGYAVTGNTNGAVASASISGGSLQINALSGGETNVTVTATDLDGNSVAQTFTVSVTQPPAFTSGAPATGRYGAAFSFGCTASGWPVPTFSVTSGVLPPGLSLSAGGVISGTPTAAGVYSGSVGAGNGVGEAASQSFSITIEKATATVLLGGLTRTYDGSPKAVSPTTNPPGLTVNVTYAGSATAPTNHGSYAVVASIADANHAGGAGGTLTITGQSAEGWRAQHFTAAQISNGQADDSADPDGDGLKNLVEYALGSSPLSRTSSLSPTRDGNGLSLIFTRPKDLPDVIYGAESSDNLSGGWNALVLEVIAEGPVQTVRARDPLSSGDPARRFIRLKLVRP